MYKKEIVYCHILMFLFVFLYVLPHLVFYSPICVLFCHAVIFVFTFWHDSIVDIFHQKGTIYHTNFFVFNQYLPLLSNELNNMKGFGPEEVRSVRV